MSETPAVEQDTCTDPDQLLVWALTNLSGRMRRLEAAVLLLLLVQSPPALLSLRDYLM